MHAVSIVIPVFNEGDILEKVIGDCHTQIIRKIPGSETIVVNDGSTDSTSVVLERLRDKFGELKVVTLDKNRGHGKALRKAFELADNPLIFHVDGDNQFRLEEFWKLYASMRGCDIAAGYRLKRKDCLRRRVISLLLCWMDMLLFGISMKDINSPFKLIRREALADIMRDIDSDFSAVPIAVMILAKLKGYRITEIPVEHFARKTGKSSMAGLYLINLCFVYFVDLIRIKFRILNGRIKNR